MTQIIKVLAISILTYLLFFYPVLNKNTVIYSGKDAIAFHYPSRNYLYEKLKEGIYPFWTERMFFGFPIFADLERSFMNPLNIVLVYMLGPFTSYKVLHFLTYLFGSICLYKLLKDLKHNLSGYFLANLIYFFSTFLLLHQQHFNSAMTLYLLPAVIYFTQKNKLFNVALVISYAMYLGSMQYVLFLIIAQLFWQYCNSKLRLVFFKQLAFQYFIIFSLSLPAIVGIFALYKDSMRFADDAIYTQGSISPLMFMNLFISNLFGNGSAYLGILLNHEYFMHEVYIYSGASVLVLCTYYIFTSISTPISRFFKMSLIFFVILSLLKCLPLINNFVPLPFSLFRYWLRSISLVNFASGLLVSEFLTLNKLEQVIKRITIKYSVSTILLLVLIELVHSKLAGVRTFISVFTRDDYMPSFTTYFSLLVLLISISAMTLYMAKRINLTFLKNTFFIVILLDIIIHGLFNMHAAFRSISEILPDIKKSSSEDTNSRTFDFVSPINGDNGLYFSSWSFLGYSVFVPETVNSISSYLGFVDTRNLTHDEESKQIYETPAFINNIGKYGVSKVHTPNGTYKTNVNFPLDISLDNKTYILSEQKYMVFIPKYENTVNEIHTFLRFDKSWRVALNGTSAKIFDDAGFLKFIVPDGTTDSLLVEIEYRPIWLLYTIIISIALFFLSIFINKKYAIIS